MKLRRTSIALAFCGAVSSAWVGCSSDDSPHRGDDAVDSGTDNATGTGHGNLDGGSSGKPSLDGNVGSQSSDASTTADGASAPGTREGDDAGDGNPGGDHGGDGGEGEGSADAGSKTCGTRGHPVTCKANEYCAYTLAAQCGAADQPGQCVRKPQICPQDIVGTGVCGCDGKTYGNECFAETAGTSVAHQGACGGAGNDAGTPGAGRGEGATCAGIAALQCDDGLFCEFPLGCEKNVSDAAGHCARIPTQCPSGGAQQVCGCDGKTYKSACQANLQSVSVDHTGTCK